MTRYVIIIFIISLFYIVNIKCNEEKLKSGKFELETTNAVKEFKLKKYAQCHSKALYVENINNKRYLAFLNDYKNEIQIYDFETTEFIKGIQYQKEGTNGVRAINGFSFINFDSIITTNNTSFELFLTNGKAEVIKKYSVHELQNGGRPVHIPGAMSLPYYSSKYYFHNNKLFIPTYIPYPIKTADQYDSLKIFLTLDLKTDKINLSNVTFPLMINEDKTFPEPTYSWCIGNNNRFILSFLQLNEIIIINNYTDIERNNSKSKFINLPFNRKEEIPYMCAGPKYGKILYDKYRNVYYRFVYPGREVTTESIDWMKITEFPPIFSIIIFDDNFKIIGETIFPENKYYIGHVFVEKEGLFISLNHPNNSIFDQNYLKFEIFTLNETPMIKF